MRLGVPLRSSRLQQVSCFMVLAVGPIYRASVKKRVLLAKGYGSFQSAWRTLQGIETVDMIRKGRVRWLVKGDAVGHAHFIGELFGLSALTRIHAQPTSTRAESPPARTSQRNPNGTTLLAERDDYEG